MTVSWLGREALVRPAECLGSSKTWAVILSKKSNTASQVLVLKERMNGDLGDVLFNEEEFHLFRDFCRFEGGIMVVWSHFSIFSPDMNEMLPH